MKRILATMLCCIEWLLPLDVITGKFLKMSMKMCLRIVILKVM